jgi:hypothetical protein
MRDGLEDDARKIGMDARSFDAAAPWWIGAA